MSHTHTHIHTHTHTPVADFLFMEWGVCVHFRCFECGAKCCFCVPCNRMVMASGYKNRKKYVDYGLPGATPLWQTQSCPYIPAFIDLSVPVPYSLTVFLPFPTKLIGCSGGYHPEDMEEHKKYIAHDMNQRQVQHRVVPEDYPVLQPEVVAGAKPAKDDLGQQLCLMPAYLANAVKASRAKKGPSAAPIKGAAKSMLAKDPKGTEVTVEVGPTVCAPTLSLSDAPEKEGRPYPCGACNAHTPVVPALPTPLWCLQISIIRGLSV